MGEDNEAHNAPPAPEDDDEAISDDDPDHDEDDETLGPEMDVDERPIH